MSVIQKTNIRKMIYQARHKYVTFNNLVIAVAFLIAAGWVWGSLQETQRNFDLQREIDFKSRQLELAKLQTESLELEKHYYTTAEYQELAARESLGLVMPGEKLLILPENSQAAKDADRTVTKPTVQAAQPEEVGNLEQWMNFLFGGYSKSIAEKK